MVEIQTGRWTPVDTCTHLERPMKINLLEFHGFSSSRVMW